MPELDRRQRPPPLRNFAPNEHQRLVELPRPDSRPGRRAIVRGVDADCAVHQRRAEAVRPAAGVEHSAVIGRAVADEYERGWLARRESARQTGGEHVEQTESAHFERWD